MQKYYACDFETTVYEGQEFTEVWLSGFAELYSEDTPKAQQSISDFINEFASLEGRPIGYFHNLKFDGSFIVDYLLREGFIFKKVADKDLLPKQFCAVISQMGQWYKIIIKVTKDKIIEFRDSLKLMPYSLENIGKSFGTKHKKLEMQYKGYRYSGCEVTKEEMEYFNNDIYVLKEALEIMFDSGHKQLTIGSCCLKEFKRTYSKEDYKMFFPNLTDFEIDPLIYGSKNADEYIRNSYKGGWCYLKPQYAGILVHNGNVYDVNSLYPSSMHSMSGNYYPVGAPQFWIGDIPHEKLNNKEWFVRFSCRFSVKEKHLPFVQIKRNKLYKATEHLTTSDIYYNGKHHRYYQDVDGNTTDSRVTLTMTRMDYELFLKHYHVYDLEILDGCYFYREIGIFDEYINKYKQQKMESTGAKREEAKLFLNNLYGKEASSDDSSYKVPFIDEEKNIVRFTLKEEHEKEPGYIACGSYITSYSRRFTIEASQLNYDKFIYADTDSIHCLGKAENIPIHKSEFCHWKHESEWDYAKFVRQKTYIEHIKTNDGYKLDIKCAGMSKGAKKYFMENMTIDDFRTDTKVKGDLKPKRIAGGIILVDKIFTIK